MSLKWFGFQFVESSGGFSLLEVSISVFLTSILCSVALCVSVLIWHADRQFEMKWEQDGMVSNLHRTLTSMIHGAQRVQFVGDSLHFLMIDNTDYALAVNQNHQFVEYMPRGGITVLADSVNSYVAQIDNRLVTITVKLQKGPMTIITGDMMGASL